MSAGAHYVRFYVADHLADTMHLSTAEHGAYMLLLWHSWRTGPLPDNGVALARIARCTPKEWQAIAPAVLPFFTLTTDGLVQPRLERERQRKDDGITQRKAAGRASAEARKAQREANDRSTTVQRPLEQSFNETQHTLKPEPELEDTSLRSVSPAREPRAEIVDRDFEDFWSAYPRKVGKDAARKAWVAAKKRAPVAQIAAGLNTARWPSDPQFIPHPATWLNQGRWQDSPTAAAPEPEGKLGWMRDFAMGGQA